MLAIIQCRFNSSRLPGKALLKLSGKEILSRCVSRVKSANLVSNVLVATSKNKTDIPIVEFCNSESLDVFLGSLNDVVQRLHDAAKFKNCQKFLRICGDSPLIDPQIIDHAISLSKASEFDLVTNVFPRTFPKGQSVEIIKTSVLDRILNENRSTSQMEHPTSFIYENFERFRICSFRSGGDFANCNHSIDNESDLKSANMVFKVNNDPTISWQEIEAIYSKNKLNDHFK